MSKVFLILTILVYFTSCSSVKKNEKYYQAKFCNDLNGVMEYTLVDKTRVDCLTDEYAIEVDWAKKWAQGIGQSLYYSQMTNKKAGIALITSSKDKRFIKRVEKLSNKFDIKIFIIEKED
ncbi:hypothetical protein [Poseidonibacter antarcticus]|uniref:hypothetical protein n=1 Tax=Poseidonibacter antarcticus TaxID=2478538 RepID=UPI000EF45EFC|nr:hypothetical protein [Poseidonibacter antarcticus]